MWEISALFRNVYRAPGAGGNSSRLQMLFTFPRADGRHIGRDRHEQVKLGHSLLILFHGVAILILMLPQRMIADKEAHSDPLYRR